MHPPTSERAIEAIARMNYLHEIYQSKGLIKNDDMLYTLSVFITEPIRFINLYEWRKLNKMEICAISTFWKSLGDAMEIDFSPLSCYGKWSDGIDFYEDIATWAKQHEIDCMRPAKSNRTLADALFPMLMWWIPGFIRPFAQEVAYVLLGERMRDAFKLPEPSIFASMIGFTALQVRKTLIKYLFLPRFFARKDFSEPDPKTGRINHNSYLIEPYWTQPTFWNRWGLEALLTRLAGGLVPSSYAKHFHPEGYLIHEVGPADKSGKGIDEFKKNKEKLKHSRPAGCPFS